MRRVLLVLLLLVLSACGVPQDDRPRALKSGEVPFGLTPASPVPADQGPGRIALYFVREGKVVLSTRAVQSSTPPRELLELLFAGTSAEEREAGLISVIPASLRVEDVRDEGSTAVVTLGGPDEQVLRTQQLAYAQIVATLTPNRFSGVRFRLDDADLPVLTGDGSLSDSPVDRDDYADLIASTPRASAAPVPTPSA